MMLIHKLRTEDYRHILKEEVIPEFINTAPIFKIEDIDCFKEAATPLMKNSELFRQLAQLPRNPMIIEHRWDGTDCCLFVSEPEPGLIAVGLAQGLDDNEYPIRAVPPFYFKRDSFERIGEYKCRVQTLIRKNLGEDEEYLKAIQGEAINLMKVLAILNSPRITDTIEENRVKLNKKRTKKGKPALDSYHIVRIKKEIRRYMNQEKDSGTPLHWRRGHFKVRKSGIYWWSPSLVGSAEYGTITKDYIAGKELITNEGDKDESPL